MIKKTIYLLFGLVTIMSIYFFSVSIKSRSQNPPGLVNGVLSKCPAKPNCVNSEDPKDVEHYLAPISISISREANLSNIKKIIEELNGTIENETDSYISATFSSSIYRFIDDFEVRLDQVQQVIHFTSRSRVGHSDMGANRKRAIKVKELYLKREGIK